MVMAMALPRVEQNVLGMILQATPEEVAPFLGRFRLIDVREESEFDGEMGHIPGSECVPLSRVLEASVGWEKEKPLLMICRSGRRSQVAAEHLAMAGFRTLVNLVGGILAWRSLEYPVEVGKGA